MLKVGLPPIGPSSNHWHVLCKFYTPQQTKTSLAVTHRTLFIYLCV